MSLQHVEESPIVTVRENLTLIQDPTPSLPLFVSLDPHPKPLPDFAEHPQDLVPPALPTSWGRHTSSA